MRRLAGLVGLAHVDLAAGDDHQVGQLHQPRGRLARDGTRQDLHQVRRQPDLLQLARMPSTVGLVAAHAVGGGAMMMALPPFSAIIALLTGVADGLVEGVMAPTTPTGLAYLTMPFSGISSMMPVDFTLQQVAQRAEGLALVLDDLALHLADARDLDGDLGQPARVLGLVDRPGERGHRLVDARLAVRRDLCSIAGHCRARLDEHVGNVIVYRRLLRARFARGQLGVLHEEIFL